MSTDMHSDDTDIARCSACGGEIPPEGSEAWEASDGDCPGHVAPGSTVCGAFDPSLSWDEEEDEDEDEDDAEPPVDSFAGTMMDDITVHEVHLHGGKAVAIVEPGYACDDDGPLAGPIVDARSYVRRCLPAGWDVDEEIVFSPVYQDGSGQSRERWTFTLVRKGA